MSSESLVSDNDSSNEDIEIKRSDSSSDSERNADIPGTPECSTQLKDSEDETNESAISVLSSSDEYNYSVNNNQPSWPSLNGISSKAFTTTGRLSSDQQNILTGKASSLEIPSAIRKASSTSPLEKPSTRRFLSLDSLEGNLTKNISSLDPLERPTGIRRVSSTSPLEKLSTRRFSSLDSLEGYFINRIFSLDPLERPSTRLPSLDPLEGPSTRFPSLDPLEGPSTIFPSVDPLEETSTRFFSLSTRSTCLSNSLTTSKSPCAHIEATEPVEFTTEQNGFSDNACDWLCSFLRRHSRQFRHSVYYLLFLVAVWTLPILAGYMGITHFYLCHGCEHLPMIVYLAGISGMFVMSVQVLSVLSKRYFSPHLSGNELDKWMVVLVPLFTMFLLVEMYTAYECEPAFVPVDKHFCLRVFYNYVYYTNIAVPFVVILWMLIHIPAYYDPAEPGDLV